MVSVHIEAKDGQIAPTVLLPGDPLRAKFVAENFLEDVQQYTGVRGMLGFTGNWSGVPVSVQGTGMGHPSIAIYVTELIRFYGVQRLIRIGSCGAMQADLDLHDIVIATGASTDSSMNRIRFRGMDYAAVADVSLLRRALDAADRMEISYQAGNILSSDTFYHDDPDAWKLWAEYGVLAAEMETNALYTLAAKYGVHALSILTVSDSIVSAKELSAEDRETGFRTMVELALEVTRLSERD